MRISDDYNLAVVFPEVASEWHPTKNGALTPDQVAPYAGSKAWWKCANNHEWQATINSRSNGCDCPYCYGRFPTTDYNLAIVRPEIAKEWHPTRNGKVTPADVSPGSGKKAWWMCEHGHEWETEICHRRRFGCPVCAVEKSRKMKRGTERMIDVRPDLADEWHPTRNRELNPEDVSRGTKLKVWWKCGEGHAWKAEVKKRVKGTGCPYCTGRNVSKENNLEAVNPELAAQWHPVKNEKLTPRKVTPGSKKSVWWQCKKGHEWEAAILNRARGNGCPFCSGKRASGEHNLKVANPELAAQWHPTRNGSLIPEKVTPHSSFKVWWQCSEGHEWRTTVAHRSKGRGCPTCHKNRTAK